MTLIKRARANGAATALVLRRPVVEAIDNAPPASSPEVLALQAEIDRLETQLAEQRRSTERAIIAAHREGRDEVVADDAARIAAIERGIDAALTTWRDRLAEIDRLAVVLARAALAKVFGDDADRAGRVARAIEHRVAQLQPRMIVGVTVSADDFAGGTLADLAARLDPSVALTAAPGAPGSCRIDLRLGTVDLDPATQWMILDRALRELEAA